MEGDRTTNARGKPRRGPRVLVIRRRYLGDAVLLEPFLRNLRAHWPGAWITVALDAPYVEALAGSPDVDEIVAVPVGRLSLPAMLAGWVRLFRAIRRAPFDLAIDLAHNEASQATMLLSRAPRRVGLELEPARLRRKWLYTEVHTVDRRTVERTHSVDLNNALLTALEIPTPFRVPGLRVSAATREETARIVDRCWVEAGRPRGPRLLIHPGAGAPARRWPPEDFAYVADLAVRRLDAHVIVFGGPADGELARAVLQAMEEPASVVREPMSVSDLFGLLGQVDLLLCNDSGPMHMAAAVGTPVCALYGAESRATWAPLGSAAHTTLQPELPCGRACVAPGACVPGDPMRCHCIRRIPREAVAEAVHASLSPALAPGRRHGTRPGRSAARPQQSSPSRPRPRA